MVTDEDIEREFEEFSVSIDDLTVLDKLKQLCVLFRLSPSELVEEWIAHATGVGCNHEPTLLTLVEFERKQSLPKERKRSKQLSINQEDTKHLMFDKNNIDELINEEDEQLFECYQTPGKGAVKRPHTTPEAPINKRHTSIGRSPSPAVFSTSTFSPVSATPSVKYGSRSNSGEVVFTFNPSGADPEQVIRQHIPTSGLTVQHANPEMALVKNYKYMFQKQAEKAVVLSDLIDDMAEKLQQSLKVEEFSNLSVQSQEEVPVIGRICCDSNGKLNVQSVLLEGSQELSGGTRVKLDLSEVRQFALFPGQIVAAEGVNSTGEKLVVNKICTGMQLPFWSSLEPNPVKALSQVSEPFLMMVAAGPFTTSDSLLYEPLADLMKTVENDKPDLLILLGPFVDSKHDQIVNGDLEEPFEDLFEKQVQEIVKATEKLSSTVVFVPSHRDVHHDFVYPQPPFSTKVNLGELPERIHFVSDPCTIVVNGVTIGLTSTDILLHLGSEETVCPPGSSDRLGRLVKHILYQHSYYPLHPPAEDVNLDYEQFEKYALLPCNPDILILPSDLRYFAKDTVGSLCLNPGRLAKGLVGGTYAKVWINPTPNHLDKSSSHILPSSLVRVIRI
ncbi:DNA polymerase alpha subunit B-like [Montipora capricornis]|uniref:DNA polymerase alpha subunit B-like n=1 Tax=Montipora capricornis TaxID=246305 RepID=UPI0035F1CBBF